MEKGYIIIFILVFFMAITISAGIYYYTEKLDQEKFEFYSKWCPKFNMSAVDRRPGYTYFGKCFEQQGKEIVFYEILEFNGNKYLNQKK